MIMLLSFTGLSRSPMKTNQNNEDNITGGGDSTNKSPGRIRIKMFNFNKLKKVRSRCSTYCLQTLCGTFKMAKVQKFCFSNSMIVI